MLLATVSAAAIGSRPTTWARRRTWLAASQCTADDLTTVTEDPQVIAVNLCGNKAETLNSVAYLSSKVMPRPDASAGWERWSYTLPNCAGTKAITSEDYDWPTACDTTSPWGVAGTVKWAPTDTSTKTIIFSGYTDATCTTPSTLFPGRTPDTPSYFWFNGDSCKCYPLDLDTGTGTTLKLSVAVSYNALYTSLAVWLPDQTCGGGLTDMSQSTVKPAMLVGPFYPGTCNALKDSISKFAVCGDANANCYVYMDVLSYGGPSTTCVGLEDKESAKVAASEKAKKEKAEREVTNAVLIVLGVIGGTVVAVIVVGLIVGYSLLKKKKLNDEINAAKAREVELDERLAAEAAAVAVVVVVVPVDVGVQLAVNAVEVTAITATA